MSRLAAVAAPLADGVARHSAPVTHLGERLVAVVILLGLVLGTFAAMRRGWRGRARRQADLPPLTPIDAAGSDLAEPADAPPPLTGQYHGSVFAGDWLDRVVAHGLGPRSPATLRWTTAGVAVERPGAASFLILTAALAAARIDRAIAGVTPPPGGLLVLTWRHGGRLIDSGFRAERLADQAAWAAAVTARVAPPAPAHAGDPGAADDNCGET